MAFPTKFSDEQRANIVCAVLDDNHTVREAVDAAAAGQIGPAFTITMSTVYSLVAAERKRRRSIFDVADDQAQRLMQLCDRELTRLEALPVLEPADARNMRGIAKTNRIVRLIAADVEETRWAAGDPLDFEEPAPGLAALIAGEVEA